MHLLANLYNKIAAMRPSVKFMGVILLALFSFLSCQAQQSSSDKLNFEISIPTSYHLSNSTTDADRINALMTANLTARTALASVTIYSFHQKFPGSHYQYLRNIYELTCANTLSNDSAVLSLHATDPVNFVYLREMPAIIALGGSYTPDDYHGVTGADCSTQLDFINATTAWGITKGNPKITLGINDPSGFDLKNPDLKGQIIGVDSFNRPDFHGTAVAGCAAAHTDNGIGIAGIGFNCSLSVDSRGGDDISLLMSNAGLRVINNSWFYGFYCTSTYQPGIFVEDELVYDEVYENGTSTCFAAGNGLSGDGHCPSIFSYAYPGTLDHIITVGPTGHQNSSGTNVVVNSSCPPSGIPWLWKYCHAESPGNDIGQYGTLNYQANDRVDICAPAYNVVSTVYTPVDTSIHYTNAACGTSFASPIVTGALGLMLSANPCLSPYQLEYLLKTTAHNMDYIEYPPGSGTNLNQYYVGKMGAGALDAGAAVTAANTFNCNDTSTQTMYIEGIELNTICAPGYSSNGVKPTFSVIIDHGTPPYTYRWDVIPGNNTTLDDYVSATPSVTSGNFAAYRLGVYDASPIPKEASRLIVVNLTTDQTPKLVMRDSYMDMANEPNSQADNDAYDWQLWLSPDLVNRVNNDQAFINQNPVYAPSTANYLNARVRNEGCVTSSGTEQLDLYWTKASTGETWPGDWTNTTPISIPAIAPGSLDTLSAAWYPPNPANYDASITSVDVCLLGRIETSPTSPYGMSTAEGINTAINVTNNNKIATRNLVINTANSTEEVQWHQILLANAENTDQEFSFEFASEKQLHPSFSGDISAYARVEIQLGGLFDRWAANGEQGTNILVDTKAKSVVFPGDSKIFLKGITLHANEKYAVKVGIIYIQQPVSDQYFHIRQWIDSTDVQAYIPYGDVSFMIPGCSGDSACAVISDQNASAPSFASSINAYPNPSSNNVSILYTGYDQNTLSYSIADISGQVLSKQSGIGMTYGSVNNISVAAFSDGLYFIKLTDKNNNSTTIKIVKD
jgi:hypothetical protein